MAESKLTVTKAQFQKFMVEMQKVIEDIADRKMQELEGFVKFRVNEEMNSLLSAHLYERVRKLVEGTVWVTVNVSASPNTPASGQQQPSVASQTIPASSDDERDLDSMSL